MAGYLIHRGITPAADQFKTWFTGSPNIKAVMEKEPMTHTRFLHKMRAELM
jgi:hypothetical protein